MNSKTFRRLCAGLLVGAGLASTLSSCGAKPITVMSYKDSEITANQYSYWLSTYKTEFLNYYEDAADEDAFWDDTLTVDGVEMTVDQYATDLINNRIKYTLIGIQLFREYGLKIDADTTQAIDDDINEKIDFYGSRADMNTALSAIGLNADMLKDVYIAEEKLVSVYDHLYGEGGIEQLSEAEIDDYYESMYSRIKYIVVYTDADYVYDEEGNIQYDENGYMMTRELTDEEKSEKQAKLEEIMLCVNAGDDFLDIQKEYNEVDMSYYENGFYVSPNELGTYGFTMITAVQEMQEGEIRMIEDTHSTYVVQKLPLLERKDFEKCDEAQMENLTAYAVQQKYEEKFSALAEEVTLAEEELSKFSVRTAALNSYF